MCKADRHAMEVKRTMVHMQAFDESLLANFGNLDFLFLAACMR